MLNTATRATIFTPSQIHLLRMFELDKSPKGLEELRSVLYRHYSRRMEDKLDELWNAGVLDQQRLDEIAQTDLHKL